MVTLKWCHCKPLLADIPTFIFHRKFVVGPDYLRNDLALVKVEPMKFHKLVRHICLPKRDDEEVLYRKNNLAKITGKTWLAKW